MNLCYRINETHAKVEEFLAELRDAVKSATPIDIVFRTIEKEFVLYLSKQTDRDDDLSIAAIASAAGFSAVVLVSGQSEPVTLRLSPGGAFLYEGSTHAAILARESSSIEDQAFNTAANARIRMKQIEQTARKTADAWVSLNPLTPLTNKARRDAAIEERLLEL